jgi:hypothetical protein
MKMLYAVGDALFARELLEGGDHAKVRATLQKLHNVVPVVPTRRVRRLKLATSKAAVVSSFAGIGIGKPLSVEIREIYTGKYPRGLFCGTSSAMLVTTAMKNMEVFSGAARAVNFLTKKVKPRTCLRHVDATTVGTPVVYYSPALTQMNAVLTLDIAFDEFPKEAFDVISTAAATAAGIPAFAAAGPYLVIASSIVSLAGKLGEAGFDNRPDFTATIPLTLDRPGDLPLAADYRLCMNDNGLREIGSDYRISDEGSLVRKDTGDRYGGDHPYIVLSIDGREHPEREAFTPTAATAEMVKTFFGSQSMFSTSIETALEGMRLYSDWQFRIGPRHTAKDGDRPHQAGATPNPPRCGCEEHRQGRT